MLRNNNRQGSTQTVRIGSRSIGRDALIIGSLGLLNIILLSIAVAIGIYCNSVSEMSSFQLEASHALILDVNRAQTMLNGALKEQEKAEQLLWETQRTFKQQTNYFKQNATLIDAIQKQLEGLQEEKEHLKSNTSLIKASCRRCLPGWYLCNTSCYFFSSLERLVEKNWQDSRQYCQQHGATLIVIDDASEQLTVHEHLPITRGYHTRMWIGLSKKQDQWMWENNVTQQHEGYWMRGYPKASAEHEQCAAILNTSDQFNSWIDVPCDMALDWICEMEVSG